MGERTVSEVSPMILPDFWTSKFGNVPYKICDCIEGMKQLPDKYCNIKIVSSIVAHIDKEEGWFK
jgi:hypothetical protein